MSYVEWSPNGIGWYSLVFAVFFITAFRKKVFGFLDPLIVYLVLRASPMLAAFIILISPEAVFSYYYLLAIISFSLFIVTLYYATPKIESDVIPITKRGLNELFKVAVALVVIKLIILFSASGSLPVFGDSGSDSFIGFAENNKISSSFLLAIGASELTLLALLLPVISGRKRVIIFLAIFLSSLMIISGGKKSSFLVILFAFALGDYLRIKFTSSKRGIFTNWKFVFLLFLVAILWAAYQYGNTSGTLEMPESQIISFLLDAIFFQWSYPVILFASGDLINFFEEYEVNKFTYFFHTILSPLGFPAFRSSIGPAINEYQTGQLTGNGINPSFLLEGYVLFGVVLPIYSIITALTIGRLRWYIKSLQNQRNKVLLYAILLPSVYIFPVDALLFVKISISLIIMSPFIFILTSRRIK